MAPLKELSDSEFKRLVSTCAPQRLHDVPVGGGARYWTHPSGEISGRLSKSFQGTIDSNNYKWSATLEVAFDLAQREVFLYSLEQTLELWSPPPPPAPAPAQIDPEKKKQRRKKADPWSKPKTQSKPRRKMLDSRKFRITPDSVEVADSELLRNLLRHTIDHFDCKFQPGHSILEVVMIKRSEAAEESTEEPIEASNEVVEPPITHDGPAGNTLIAAAAKRSLLCLPTEMLVKIIDEDILQAIAYWKQLPDSARQVRIMPLGLPQTNQLFRHEAKRRFLKLAMSLPRCDRLTFFKGFFSDPRSEREILEDLGVEAKHFLGYDGWDLWSCDGSARCLCFGSWKPVGFPFDS